MTANVTTRLPSWTSWDKNQTGPLVDTHPTKGALSFDELAQYRGRFPDFCRDLFGIELTPQQLEGAEALENNSQVLICGGNALGKDTLAACLALFEVYAMGGLSILSGPTDRQVREILMRREIGSLWRKAGGRLRGARYEMAIRIEGREEAGLLAFTALSSDHFQGHHSSTGRLCVCLTESQAIDSSIFEAAQRLIPTRLLAVCNPTSPTTAVYGFSRSPNWKTLHWSALDHPNVISGKDLFPGAVNRAWVESMKKEHGEDSRFWIVSVRGQFPDEAESPLFTAGRWDEAIARGEVMKAEVEAKKVHAVIGVDVARGGTDRNAIAVRRGGLLWDLQRWREPDTQVCAERIAASVRKLLFEDHLGVAAVVVDETSMGGGVFDRLSRLLDHEDFSWWEVRGAEKWRPRTVTFRTKALGFKSSRVAPHQERFVNLRSQALFHTGVMIEEGHFGIRPGIEPTLLRDLHEELVVHERQHGADDRIGILSKDLIRKSLGRSPDLADALAMSWLPALSGPPSKRKVGFHAGAAGGGWVGR